MKYTLSYTETFENELNEAFVYISEKLYNITAAERLIKNTLASLSKLKEFPFSCPVCDGKLGKVGYRKLLVGNYIVLYYVNESSKTITAANFVFAQSDYLNKL